MNRDLKLSFQEKYDCTDRTLATFDRLSPEFTDEEHWYRLGDLYTEAVDIESTPREKLRTYFSSPRGQSHLLMTEEELDFYNALPHVVTIFRGMSLRECKTKNYGISWTLSEDIAHFFANTYGGYRKYQFVRKRVHSLTVKKSTIKAVFNSRKEEEVIYIQK